MTADRNNRKLRVTVLMGGNSNERPVSLATGKMIVEALDPTRYDVTFIDTQELALLARTAMPVLPVGDETEACSGAIAMRGSDIPANATQQTGGPRHRPDLVFIALHGKGGEDGAAQGMLEMLGLPYTGSGILASALAMDKRMSKRIFRSAGIPVIDHLIVERANRPADAALIGDVERTLSGFPVFVKPNAEGSTFGCSLVHDAGELAVAVDKALKYDRIALIETYVRGREITVGVLGNTGSDLEPLPIVEIVPRGEYYDYESKYGEGGSVHIIPAKLTVEQTQRARAIAVQCHQLLGCRGMSRTDMIVTDGGLFVLEVNTIPGMTPTSLLPDAAAHAGISFSALLDRLIGYALETGGW